MFEPCLLECGHLRYPTCERKLLPIWLALNRMFVVCVCVCELLIYLEEQ